MMRAMITIFFVLHTYNGILAHSRTSPHWSVVSKVMENESCARSVGATSESDIELNVQFLQQAASIELLQRAAAVKHGGAHTVVFVLHDAGETLALLPVVKRLLTGPLARDQLLILPLGEPASSMTRCGPINLVPLVPLNLVHTFTRMDLGIGDCPNVPTITLGDLGIDVDIIDGTAGRTQVLSDVHLEKLTERLGGNISAVVTGMNYAMQRQIGGALQSTGGRFAAYYDGMTVVGTDTDDRGVQADFPQVAQEIWIPSMVLLPNGSQWYHPGTTWYAVGQPTLETWKVLSQNESALRNARTRIYGKTALDAGTPAIVWFGGYGSEYESALRIWCRGVKRIRSSGSPPGVIFSLALHPGYSGDVDKQILSEEGVVDLITIVPADISGDIAALVSNLTASQGSTGGEQSLFVGKPALFVDPSSDPAWGTHLGSLLDLIPSATSAEAAQLEVERAAAKEWKFDVSRLAHGGLPINSTGEIAARVLSLMGN